MAVLVLAVLAGAVGVAGGLVEGGYKGCGFALLVVAALGVLIIFL